MREGCADFLTQQVLQASRTGNQQTYGQAHERELWDRFRKIMWNPASFDDGWFGALDPKTPDWPPQIGYWLGKQMCAAYYDSVGDPRAAVRTILAAHDAEDMRKFADAYARKIAHAR